MGWNTRKYESNKWEGRQGMLKAFLHTLRICDTEHCRGLWDQSCQCWKVWKDENPGAKNPGAKRWLLVAALLPLELWSGPWMEFYTPQVAKTKAHDRLSLLLWPLGCHSHQHSTEMGWGTWGCSEFTLWLPWNFISSKLPWAGGDWRQQCAGSF